MKAKHLLTSDQKLKNWGYGEWIEEPDLIEFEHAGFDCKVQRIFHRENGKILFGGHLCGYICVHEGHPWYSLSAEEMSDEVSVHGGITYSERDQDDCWIGFDCAHSYDTIPSMHFLIKSKKIPDLNAELKEKYAESKVWDDTYKNVNYVIEQCKLLAEEAQQIIKNNS